jgi:hypothetical protein
VKHEERVAPTGATRSSVFRSWCRKLPRRAGYTAESVSVITVAFISRRRSSCSLAWWLQNRSSPPVESTTRARAPAPHRSHRSAAVNCGLVNVPGMTPPYWLSVLPECLGPVRRVGMARSVHSVRRLGVMRCSQGCFFVLSLTRNMFGCCWRQVRPSVRVRSQLTFRERVRSS